MNKLSTPEDCARNERVIEMAMEEFHVPREEVTMVMRGIIKVYYYDQLYPKTGQVVDAPPQDH